MWAEQLFYVHVSIPKWTSKQMPETITQKQVIA